MLCLGILTATLSHRTRQMFLCTQCLRYFFKFSFGKCTALCFSQVTTLKPNTELKAHWAKAVRPSIHDICEAFEQQGTRLAVCRAPFPHPYFRQHLSFCQVKAGWITSASPAQATWRLNETMFQNKINKYKIKVVGRECGSV